MKIIDFRSDTVTRPTTAMRQAMLEAEVGDDVFGDDPTVNALEQRVAELLGKEAALFVTSGTMANQLAIHLHCRPGDSVLAEEDSHVNIYEVGAGAALSGVQFDLVPLSESMSEEALRRRFREPSLHAAPTRLLVVENTHNRNGGEARNVAAISKIAATGQALGLKLHCDGARLWNAAVRFGVSEADLVAPFDSVAVCFSKGLGAPVGSALLGSKDFIQEARRIRKRWGGGMRQAGVIAAGALYALENHRARLAEDHRLAAELTSALIGLNGKGVLGPVKSLKEPTNMAYVQLKTGSAADVLVAAREKRLILQHVGGDVLRFVTHMDLPVDTVSRTRSFFENLQL